MLQAMFGRATDRQLINPVLAAAAELVRLSNGTTGDRVSRARIGVMRRIDTYVDQVLPIPTELAVLHTETVSMVLVRMADYAALPGRPVDVDRLSVVWGPLDELVCGLDALTADLLAGRRRVPLSIWWNTSPESIPLQEKR
ncbi:hypothetical protein BOX37_28135 [Nocardia mangyaensis]|uniref:Uncharacterized protein n=1 Tax=Nocardia mangyaensis TaxID=2213200 RepID=A0A1J0VYS4_9NOCA|nr:hypothetical protein BOX37_28135 [Nocardia mangyaensis]